MCGDNLELKRLKKYVSIFFDNFLHRIEQSDDGVYSYPISIVNSSCKYKAELTPELNKVLTAMRKLSGAGNRIDLEELSKTDSPNTYIGHNRYNPKYKSLSEVSECENKHDELKKLVRSFFEDYLDRVEDSSSGRYFNPIAIVNCRALLTNPLSRTLSDMRKLSGARERVDVDELNRLNDL